MTTMKLNSWQSLPPIEAPAAVLALAAGGGVLWAGGAGGVARRSGDGTWQWCAAGLPLQSVAALCYAGGWLLAGGAGGIARSRDGGASWQAAHIEGGGATVAALAPSPRFAEDTTALAATLGAGVLRTVDAGRSWKAAGFGLGSADVSALAWLDDSTVLAATDGGVYRSPNAGRAWKLCDGTDGAPVAALAVLGDGGVVAAVELGGLLRSDDGGASFKPFGGLAPDTELTALLEIPGGLLAGSANRGLLSVQGGSTTCLSEAAVFALLRSGAGVFAATERGVMAGDDAATLGGPERAPLHDLRRLLLVGGSPLVYGVHSQPQLYRAGQGWAPLDAAPLPLTAMALAPDGALLASSTDGMFRSADAGQSWEPIVPGATGCVAWLTFRSDGSGWAGSADGRLLRTRDGGLAWEQLDWPFGVLPLAALQAMPGAVFAATYDARRGVAQIWRSADDGTRWERGAAVATGWPFVATLDQPTLLTLGRHIVVERDGRWERQLVGGDVYRIAGSGDLLLALTSDGAYRSADRGAGWAPAADELPPEPVFDIAIAGDTVYALAAGGRVFTRSLSTA